MTYSELFEKYRGNPIGIRRVSWPKGRFLISHRYLDTEKSRFADFLVKAIEGVVEINTYRPHASIWIENMQATDWIIQEVFEKEFQELILKATEKFRSYREYLNHPQWMTGAIKGTIL